MTPTRVLNSEMHFLFLQHNLSLSIVNAYSISIGKSACDFFEKIDHFLCWYILVVSRNVILGSATTI